MYSPDTLLVIADYCEQYANHRELQPTTAMITDDPQAVYSDDDYVHEYRMRMRREKLRDRFAIAALTAIIHHKTSLFCEKLAYEIADRMMEAREQKGGEHEGR